MKVSIIKKDMIMRQWIFFIIMGCSVCACKQDIDLYEGNSSIYFDDNSAGVYDISWSTYDSDVKKMTVQLQVNLSGMVKDYPRKFNIEVISSETDSLHSVAGVDYTPLALEYEMPALANHMMWSYFERILCLNKRGGLLFSWFLMKNWDLNS